MDRTLVTNLSSFELSLVMIALFVVPGAIGVWAVRRWAPRASGELRNEVTGAVITFTAALYGVMLAFVIVVLYEDYRDAQSDVHTESGALSNLYRSSQELPPRIAVPMKRAIASYVDEVTGPEWKAMSRGESTTAGWADVERLYKVLGTYEPRTQQQRAFFANALTAVSAVIAARRARVEAARASLPKPFLVLIIFGGYLLLMYNLFFDIRNRRYHLFVVVSVAALIGFSLMLALALEFPFSGGISVSPEAYHEGGLAGLTNRP